MHSQNVKESIALIDIISATFVSHRYENERSLTYDADAVEPKLGFVLSAKKNFAVKCQHLDTSNINYGGSSGLSKCHFFKCVGVFRLEGDRFPFRVVCMYVLHIILGVNVQVLHVVCSLTTSCFRTSHQSDLSSFDISSCLLHFLNPCLRVQSQVFHHLKLSTQHPLRCGY